MQQPQGFFHSSQLDLLWRLHKSMYGLKQTPCPWFEKFRSIIIGLGLYGLRIDNSLFFKHTSSHSVFFLVYVDDVIITKSSSVKVENTISQLNTAFA